MRLAPLNRKALKSRRRRNRLARRPTPTRQTRRRRDPRQQFNPQPARTESFPLSDGTS